MMLVLTAFVGMSTSVSAEELVAEANGPYTGYECHDMYFDATGSSEQSGVLYTWLIDGSPNPTTELELVYLWQDDYDDIVTLEVSYADSTTATDTTSVTVYNVPPTILSVDGPSVQELGVEFLLEVVFYDGFWDPTRGLISSTDTFTATFDWDDGTVDTIGQEEMFLGEEEFPLYHAMTSHVYGEIGVYLVTITITDDDGGFATIQWWITVYDPAWVASGFVTGGGWINAPEGSYPADPTLAGKATFGFVSKYKKGQNIPEGNTEFQFHAAGLNFHSLSYEYLVVAGPMAMYKGVGTVNGEGSYRFLITARDGQITGGDGIDTFRIKIWYDGSEGSVIVFDNGANTPLEGGQITIHKV